MKKIVSSLLVISMMISMSTTVFAANCESLFEKSLDTYQIQFVSNYEMALQTNGAIRSMVVFDRNLGTVDIVSINDETGIITINDDTLIPVELRSQAGISSYAEDNWTEPQTSVTSLSLATYTTGAIVGFLALKYGVPSDKATYIAGLVIGAGGFLYVKSVVQLNYVDYSPKVGYRLTESLHLTPEADGESLFVRTTTGSR